ncbi:MAG: hypothetical protein ACPG7F_01950 [Aggregatilineales bacterium]
MPDFPERQPVGDPFTGVISQMGDYILLSPEPLPDARTLFTGQFMVRYAIVYLERPYLSIVPELVALDYGDMLNGNEAWQFLLHNSNLHPRADVIGYRNDGEDEMIVLKKLDMARPPRVLVYGSPVATLPIVEASALICADTTSIPQRMRKHLPIYPSLNIWHTNQPEKKHD